MSYDFDITASATAAATTVANTGSLDVGYYVATIDYEPEPIKLLLTCPSCGERHVDEGRYATKPHHTHACQHCGMVWRPAIEATVGVQFLPGFKDHA